MKCECGYKLKVVETRTDDENNLTYRHFLCGSCGKNVYSEEKICNPIHGKMNIATIRDYKYGH